MALIPHHDSVLSTTSSLPYGTMGTASANTHFRRERTRDAAASIDGSWIYVSLWIVLGLALLPWDVAIARWCAQDRIPGDIAALFARAEVFGHGYGVAGIAITIYLLDPARRRALPRLLTSFVAAGLSADLLKLQFWRMRPRYFLELVESEQLSTYVGSVWTIATWDTNLLRQHQSQSFPSAHTAGAVALAYALSRIYPAGRHWFYLLVVFCALNRVTGNAHFASDVCWGAALGYALAAFVDGAFRRKMVERSARKRGLLTSS